MSLVVNTLCKNYGHQVAVNEVSFELKPGEIVGFLGPNGAGKSTTLKMLAGFLEADKGSIVLHGERIHPNASTVKKQIGYLPESNALYQDLYVKEYLQFLTAAHSITNAAAAIQSVIEKTGLGEMQNKKIAALSKGYKQRLGIAAAILHKPTLILLDEPTAGLDPNQLIEIRALIQSLSKDSMILFSTHILQEVTAICDRVLVLHQGRLVADEPTRQLLDKHGASLEEIFKMLTH
jgi:ABC-2 type transport system ATP-binding protein